MATKSVSRTVRLDPATDERLEVLASAGGVTVSELIRTVLVEATERDTRRRRLEEALRVAASLPDRAAADRDEMWGTEARVPR